MPFNILMVSARAFPYMGGVETHIHEVSRRLACMGHTVTVLSTDAVGGLPPEEHADGVRILRVPAWPREKDYHVAPGVYDRVLSGAWDVVHCQGYNTAVPPIAMTAALRAHIPYVVTFHSGGHSSGLRRASRSLQQAALRPLLARASRLIGVSAFEAEFFARRLRLPGDRFVVIPNGSAVAPSTSMAMDHSDDAPLILSIGRLERYKGHHRIIAAMPEVLRQLPTARLRILGTGPEEEHLGLLAQNLDIGSRVQIGSIDPKQRQSMADALSQATLVTLLSDYEAHPISVMEALAAGKPVLVTHTSGLAELADRGLVRSIPLRSSTAEVAQALVRNVTDPLIPPPTVLPTWDDCATRLSEVYGDILNGRAS
jgi:glycogen synthase